MKVVVWTKTSNTNRWCKTFREGGIKTCSHKTGLGKINYLFLLNKPYGTSKTIVFIFYSVAILKGFFT